LLETNKIELNLRASSDKKLAEKYEKEMRNFKFDEALKILWGRLRKGDEVLSDKKPWKLDPSTSSGLKEIKNILEPIASDILNVVILLKPFMPTVSEKVIRQFSNKQIKKGESLFPRI